jgi:hypothetical protein
MIYTVLTLNLNFKFNFKHYSLLSFNSIYHNIYQ